jgi:hypothetical protein
MKAPRKIEQPRDKIGRYDLMPARIPTAAPHVPKNSTANTQLTLKEWYCPRCRTTDPSLRYPSGKVSYCIDCQRYLTLSSNAKKVRSNGEAPGVDFDIDSFRTWVRSQDRRCSICQLPESQVGALQLKTSVGYTVAVLGIDRVDNTRGYALDNIQLCCFACNKAKGNVFNTDESSSWLGQGIASAWTHRLEGANDETIKPNPYGYATVSYFPGTCKRCGFVGPGADIACKPCRKFDALTGNANRARSDGSSPGVTFTREEFSQWFEEQTALSCRYCRVPEGIIPVLGLKTQMGHDLKYLGIDRINNDKGYEMGNIALCCYACNKVKGNVFSDDEMRDYVGPQISKIWNYRVFGRRL